MGLPHQFAELLNQTFFDVWIGKFIQLSGIVFAIK